MLIQLREAKLQTPNYSLLLQDILEGLVDGIIILTLQCEQIYLNQAARQICRQMDYDNTQIHQSTTQLPKEIQQACQTLVKCLNQCSKQLSVIESEIILGKGTKYRVRARWLPSINDGSPYVLMLFEDYYQSIQKRALAEAQQYKLSHRETEVWVLRRTEHSYQDIASRLYISFNTVKKHLKNIHIKQQNILDSRSSNIIFSDSHI
jgi:DNA-binding CsgD family transcriptional regulator